MMIFRAGEQKTIPSLLLRRKPLNVARGDTLVLKHLCQQSAIYNCDSYPSSSLA
jgi:hypothetical protein